MYHSPLYRGQGGRFCSYFIISLCRLTSEPGAKGAAPRHLSAKRADMPRKPPALPKIKTAPCVCYRHRAAFALARFIGVLSALARSRRAPQLIIAMISSWLRSGWRARLTAVAMTPAVSEMISSISRGVTTISPCAPASNSCSTRSRSSSAVSGESVSMASRVSVAA